METLLEQQTSYRIYGAELAAELVDLIGAKNLELAEADTSVDTTALLTNLSSVKLLLETGSLKTARTLCQYYGPSYPDYADVFDHGVESITDFLVGGDYEEDEGEDET